MSFVVVAAVDKKRFCLKNAHKPERKTTGDSDSSGADSCPPRSAGDSRVGRLT